MRHPLTSCPKAGEALSENGLRGSGWCVAGGLGPQGSSELFPLSPVVTSKCWEVPWECVAQASGRSFLSLRSCCGHRPTLWTCRNIVASLSVPDL